MSTDLAARVAALERQIAQLGTVQSEAAVPNYLTADAAGNINADFTGHVHAQGLDLDAGSSNTSPSVDRLRWLRTTDGAAVADLVGESIPGGIEALAISAYTPTQADTSEVQLIAADDLGTGRAGITVKQQNRGATFSMTINPGAITFFDQAGNSSFLQAGSLELSSLFATVVTWPGGSGLSNVKNVKLTGAIGQVFGTGSPTGFAGGTLEIPRVAITADAAGGINITAQTTAIPGAGQTVTVWGLMAGT